ncbi:PTS transporter subunit EIIC [Aerococcaceae bacterium DSM 111021]|nr:PTS transporter subunit EIIC [Aerococcaceae bacterium DSM 111021]
MMGYLQRLGRSLMLPVAVLPLAALMLGIGYAIDPSGWGGESQIAAFLIAAGGAILDNLGILFAIGVSLGMTKDRDGASAIAGLVAFLTLITILSSGTVAMLTNTPLEEVNIAFEQSTNGNVFFGLISGVVAAEIYNRFSRTTLPMAFAFFSGRRLVPILTGIAMLGVSLILLFVWPILFGALVSLGEAFTNLGWIGAGLYAFFNRLLIPTGLHHALNAVFWFDLIGINDIGNFWSGTGELGITGMYQAGFFPVFMFGLPAAGIAMWQQSNSKYRSQVFSLFLAGGVAAFVTGVTEPIEFAFMFVAPALYFVHAVLTALSVAFAAFMQWTAGFGFSAGAIDFLLSQGLPLANNPWMLMVQGAVVGLIYYVVFTFVIKKFDLATPGRKGPLDEQMSVADESPTKTTTTSSKPLTKEEKQAAIIYDALGGKENIADITNCATRLRLTLNDTDTVDVNKIKGTGVPGVNVVDKKNLQVIVGTNVQSVADALQDIVDTQS